MNKNTANSMQFIGRVGNASTKPSARGVNLLGWGEPEGPLSDQEQIDNLRRKVAKLQASLDGCKTKAERAAVGKEICVLNLQINELKGGSKAGGRDFANYLCDVIKESVPKLTWERYVAEARKRHEAAEASVPSREEVAAC